MAGPSAHPEPFEVVIIAGRGQHDMYHNVAKIQQDPLTDITTLYPQRDNARVFCFHADIICQGFYMPIGRATGDDQLYRSTYNTSENAVTEMPVAIKVLNSVKKGMRFTLQPVIS